MNKIYKSHKDWEAFFARIKPGKTAQQISAITKVSPFRARQVARQFGYELKETPARPEDIFTPKETAISKKWRRFFREIPKGLTDIKVAELAGRKTTRHIRTLAERYGYKLPPKQSIQEEWATFFREIPKGLTALELASMSNRGVAHIEKVAARHGYKVAPARSRKGWGPFTQ